MRWTFYNKTMLFATIAVFAAIVACTGLSNPKPSNFMEFILSDIQIENYSMETEEYKKQNVRILYPKLNSHFSRSKLDQINEMIRIGTLDLFFNGDFEDDFSHEMSVYELEYEIKYFSTSYISIVYKGYFNVYRSAHPTHLFYTLNIDLNSMEPISLKDIVDIDEVFLRKFTNAIDDDIYFQNISDENILKNLEKTASAYFTKTHLYIVYYLPFILGNYTIIEITNA
ncbi:MAG: hypothetical protein FWH14_04465 [Oscillospiraceae bacterium]|nr:hypothetical protein [Oscillospiraceae bacterium]